jgi:hypothetical protein
MLFPGVSWPNSVLSLKVATYLCRVRQFRVISRADTEENQD